MIASSRVRLVIGGIVLLMIAGCALVSRIDPGPWEDPPPDPEPLLATPDGRDWDLVFADEFEGDALSDKWNTCFWWQLTGGCTIASNDELQWYRPEAVSVEGGTLRLTAQAIEQRTDSGDLLPYRSGMVSSGRASNDLEEPPKFAFTYGYAEARVVLPAGSGMWPTFWLLSADNTSLPEIDVFEWYGSRPELFTMHVHQRIDGESENIRREIAIPDATGGTFVFAVRWAPDAVIFYLDGVETGRITDSAFVPTTPMYVILNLAVGGGAGAPDPTLLPQTFQVDYVRVWQTDEESP